MLVKGAQGNFDVMTGKRFSHDRPFERGIRGGFHSQTAINADISGPFY